MVDDPQHDWLNANVSLYRRMPADLQEELRVMIPEFISKVRWRGEEGFMITEEMKVCIAAEACIPVLKLRGGMEVYRRFESIEIFPEDLRKVSGRGVAGDANGRRVRLGWHWAKVGMNDGEDGYNLVIHEFAHVIDFASLDGKADGVPQFNSYSETRDWEKFVAQNYEDFQRELGQDNESFDDYGSSNEAEFFACATESFYERGAKFNQEWPEIYARLKEFYGVDPLLWKTDPRPAQTAVEGPVTKEESEAPPVIEEPKPEPEKEPEPEEEHDPEEAIQESDLLSVKVNAGGLGNVTEYHPNGKRAFSWEVRNFLNEGPWRRWNSQGDIIEEGWYRAGVRDGIYKLRHANGKTRLEGKYRDNRRDGLWQQFDVAGNLQQETHYVAGDLVRWEVWESADLSHKYGAWD